MPDIGDLCVCREEGTDGIDDLVLKFSTREMVRALELVTIPRRTVVPLTLTGTLVDGAMFEASDCIVAIGQPSEVRRRSRVGNQGNRP